MHRKRLFAFFKNGLKHLLSSKTKIILFYILKNYQTKIEELVTNKRFTANASTFKAKSPLASLSFLEKVYQQLFTYSDLASADLAGKTLLEIGPGENVGLALKFISAGAEKVICLDKFRAARDTNQEYELYRLLREALNQEEKCRFDRAINLLNGKIELNNERLVSLYGRGIDEAEKLFNDSSFDLIYSNAVLEHVFAIDRAFAVMDRLLKPGGRMLHIVDFKDHGLFSSRIMHALEFLTIPDFLYKMMSRYIALPNRRLVNFYRCKLTQLNYQSKFYIQQLINFTDLSLIPDNNNLNSCSKPDSPLLPLKVYKEQLALHTDYNEAMLAYVKRIKPRVLKRFRSLADTDLLTGAVIISARKTIENLV